MCADVFIEGVLTIYFEAFFFAFGSSSGGISDLELLHSEIWRIYLY